MPPGLKQLRTSSGLQQQQQNHHHHPTSTLSPLTQYTNHHRLPNHNHQPPSHHPSSHHHSQNNHHQQQLQQHSQLQSVGENGVSNSGGGGRFSCPYTNCDKSFDDLTKFKEHNRSHQSLKPFHCRYGRCSATSSKKGNLRRHIRQVHKSVRPVDADQYIEEDRETLKAEEEIFAAQFCTRKRTWNQQSSSSSPGNGGTNSTAAISNGLDLQQILVNHGDSSFDSSSDFDSSDVLTLAAELCITALPGVNAASSSSSSSTAKGESEILPASATAAQFSTILRTAGGQYLCPFAGGCTSAFYDVSHLKIHYRVHTALLPYRCTWPELATSAAAVSSSCRFESTRKGNVVRHIRARHLIEPGQRQLSSVDPFDYVSTRTAWIKWEDAMFERATVLSITEFQQQQQQQLQQQQQQQQQQMMMMSKKKSSSSGGAQQHSRNVHSSKSPYFTQQASTSSAMNGRNHRSSEKRKQTMAASEAGSINIDWSSLFSQS